MKFARPLVLISLLCFGLLSQGCAHYRVVVPEPTPATDYEKATLHVLFWGAWEDTQSTENCVDNAIDEVRAIQTLPNVLATVVTLGIWMPMDIEWRCAKRETTPGSGF